MELLSCEVVDDDYVNVSTDFGKAQSKTDNTCESQP
jgi:hypothetical protein